jgi:hypothetical protein
MLCGIYRKHTLFDLLYTILNKHGQKINKNQDIKKKFNSRAHIPQLSCFGEAPSQSCYHKLYLIIGDLLFLCPQFCENTAPKKQMVP